MNISINSNNRDLYKPLCCQRSFRIDIATSYREKVGYEPVTTEVALKALRGIETKSKVLGFLTNKFTVLAAAAIVLLASAVLSVVSGGVALPLAAITAMKATAIALYVVGLIGMGIAGYNLGYERATIGRTPMSKAYNEQAQKAREYITQIKATQSLNIPFAITVQEDFGFL